MAQKQVSRKDISYQESGSPIFRWNGTNDARGPYEEHFSEIILTSWSEGNVF